VEYYLENLVIASQLNAPLEMQNWVEDATELQALQTEVKWEPLTVFEKLTNHVCMQVPVKVLIYS
jgi:hypothetical protein